MASCSCSAKCLLSTEQTGSSWQASVSLANKSSHKDSSQPFCIFLAQKDNFVFRDCLWKCGGNVTLKIGKCLHNMHWSYRRIRRIIKLRFRNLFPASPSFSKKRKRGYVTSFYGSKFAVFKKKKWIWVIIK